MPRFTFRRLAAVRPAFTLIELLVVISIIALLIGILLPALGAAREAGRSTVCLANLRSAGQGMHAYGADFKGYYPGMNTSGAKMVDGSGLSNAQKVAAAGLDPSQPLQADDWVSPSLGYALGLPKDGADRMMAIFNDEFRCPSNATNYSGLFAGGDIYGLANENPIVSSYGMNIIWQYQKTGTNDDDIADGDDTNVTSEVDNNYSTAFLFDGVKNASNKVVVSDGAKYMTDPGSSDGGMTYNGDSYSEAGTNFTHSGWIYTTGGGGPYRWGNNGSSSTNSVGIKELAPGSVANAFRHSSMSINMLKFDGSAFNSGVEEAVNIEYHVPKGAVLANTASTADPNDSDGQVVNQ